MRDPEWRWSPYAWWWWRRFNPWVYPPPSPTNGCGCLVWIILGGLTIFFYRAFMSMLS